MPTSTSQPIQTQAMKYLEKQLEGTRITRKGDHYPKIASPSLKVMASGRKCPSRPATTTFKTCPGDFDRHIKRRIGCSLRGTHCKGNLVNSRKQIARKLPDTKGSLTGPKIVPRPLLEQNIAQSYRQHHNGCLYKQGASMKSDLLCALLW